MNLNWSVSLWREQDSDCNVAGPCVCESGCIFQDWCSVMYFFSNKIFGLHCPLFGHQGRSEAASVWFCASQVRPQDRLMQKWDGGKIASLRQKWWRPVTEECFLMSRHINHGLLSLVLSCISRPGLGACLELQYSRASQVFKVMCGSVLLCCGPCVYEVS